MDINKIRLGTIFRTLSSTKAQKTDNDTRLRDKATSTATPSEAGESRNPDELKTRLRDRLVRLRKESQDFAADAPRVTIHEILVWQFGEDVLNDPDFKRISQTLTQAISDREDLNQHMSKLISSLVD